MALLPFVIILFKLHIFTDSPLKLCHVDYIKLSFAVCGLLLINNDKLQKIGYISSFVSFLFNKETIVNL